MIMSAFYSTVIAQPATWTACMTTKLWMKSVRSSTRKFTMKGTQQNNPLAQLSDSKLTGRATHQKSHLTFVCYTKRRGTPMSNSTRSEFLGTSDRGAYSRRRYAYRMQPCFESSNGYKSFP